MPRRKLRPMDSAAESNESFHSEVSEGGGVFRHAEQALYLAQIKLRDSLETEDDDDGGRGGGDGGGRRRCLEEARSAEARQRLAGGEDGAHK